MGAVFLKHWECAKCHEESIQVVYTSGQHRDFKDIVLSKDTTAFDREVRCFKCASCGAEYTIDWRIGIPLPFQGDINKLLI